MDATQSIMIQCVIAILWKGKSGSLVLTFLKLTSHPWKPSSTAETEKHALSGTLPYSPSCVSLGLGPELYGYVAPLDRLVITLLRQCVLVVGQRKACSSWKSVLEGNTARPSGACWGAPSVCCLKPCNTCNVSALGVFIPLLLWFVYFLAAAADSCQTIL